MIKIITRTFATDPTVITREDEAAQSLKEILQNDLAAYPNARGTVYIMSSIRIFGQKRNDIDLLLMGFIENLTLQHMDTINSGRVDELEINSFICNFEVKSHTFGSVRKDGPDYKVRYNGIWSNSSVQCREAKFSMKNYLEDEIGLASLFMADILWFRGLSDFDLTRMRGNSLDNALPLKFTFKDLIKLLLRQVEVRHYAGSTHLDSFSDGAKEYQSIVDRFSSVRTPVGLTRKKFELLSSPDEEVNHHMDEVGKKLTILTGRAGTGKTVQLLQLAFRLASEDFAQRCLILTYNHALVCDIQRLIDYTPMPSKVDGRTVAIKTIHSFFHTLLKETGIKDKLNPNSHNYEESYQKALRQLYKFIVDECKKEDIEVLKDMAESYIDWDYVLIDEAQDFSDIEKKILFKVYGTNRLIVADGVDQFMRTNQRQIWEHGMDKSLVRKPKAMKLERRQKANLVSFINAFARMSSLDWEVQANNDLPGGEVHIYPEFKKSIYTQLKENCTKNECEDYDILILVPPSQVHTSDNGSRHFIKADTYERAGIPIFDGINSHKRTTYPTKEQCRVYQYDSCRGLEGWCVVCYNFDELIEYKSNTYTPDDDALGFDRDTAKMRAVMLWALMPFTRPIDTLVITLRDKDSEIGKMLYILSNSYPGIVHWHF